jgi:hypothetical protein
MGNLRVGRSKGVVSGLNPFINVMFIYLRTTTAVITASFFVNWLEEGGYSVTAY